MNYTVSICDDEQSQIAYLTDLVRRWAEQNGNFVEISEYNSAESFWFAYAENKTVDILLLDIEMQQQNGIELAKQIRQANQFVQIIFITGYPDFIAEGYEVAALHYLMKPVKEDKLFEVLDKAVMRLKKEEKTSIIDTAEGTVKIFEMDILYVEAFAHNTEIHLTKSGSIKATLSISELEKSLDTGAFIRCHRSYLIGIRHISRITKTEVILDSLKAIPLSRRLYNEANRAFIDYYKGGK